MFEKYPCTDAELNYGCEDGKYKTSIKASIRKHNKIAKILELWPNSIIPKRYDENQKPLKNLDILPGLIDKSNFEVTVYGGDVTGEKKNCITIFLKSNEHSEQKGAWFLFKKKENI